MIQFPPIPKHITTILWDMDGVLVDSEEIWEQQYPEFLLTKFGIDNFNGNDYSLILGKTLPRIYQKLCERYPKLRNISEQDFIDAEFDYAINNIYPNTTMYPGFLEFLDTCQSQRLQMGVVSSSPLEWIKACCQKHDLEKYFGIFISGFEENISKPDPQIYLLGAKQFQTNPRKCLVIEDSKSGIQAGIKAGMTVWKFSNNSITPL